MGLVTMDMSPEPEFRSQGSPVGAILAVNDKITNNHAALGGFSGHAGLRWPLLCLVLVSGLWPAAAFPQGEPKGDPSLPAAGEFVAPLKILTKEGLVEPRALRKSLLSQLQQLGYGPWPQAAAERGGAARPSQGFIWPYKDLLYRGGKPQPLSSLRYSQPALCQLGDSVVVFLERGYVLGQEVAGVSYRVLSQRLAQRKRSAQSRSQVKVDSASSALSKAAGAALAALLARPWPKKPWPEKPVRKAQLRLALQGYPPGPASLCWNLAFLSEASTVPAVFVSSFAAAYRAQLIRYYLAEHQQKSRPHIQVMVNWQRRGSAEVVGELRNQSGINGQHISLAEPSQSGAMPPVPAATLAASNLQASISISANSGVSQIQVVYPKSWFTYLHIEADRLDRRTPPRIVARYGTWAYLDRGRGYGLTINQRFVGLQEGSSRHNPAFAGHVVKFFGYSAGIKDADGKAITDGAIIYLRSGRDKAVIGSPVFPDQAVYP